MAPADQKTITLPLNEFMDMQDKLANAMTIYRGVAMKMLEASSNSLHITTDALTNLHSYTLHALNAAEIPLTTAGLSSHPTIFALLKNSKDSIRDFDSLNLPHATTIEKTKKSKAARKPKDPDAPKRPDTAYLRFANQNREKYADKMKREDPNVTRGAIAKKLTQDWNDMDEKHQQPYKDSYRSEMAEYNIKKAEYEKKTGKKLKDKEIDADEEQAVVAAAPKEAGEETSEDDDDSDDTSKDSDDEEPTPPPNPKPAKGAKGKAAAAAAAAKKETPKDAKKGGKETASAKKRKAADDADEGSKKKKKAADDDEGGKKKKKATAGAAAAAKSGPPIDPQLEKLDKESKRQKRKSQHGEDY